MIDVSLNSTGLRGVGAFNISASCAGAANDTLDSKPQRSG